MPPNEYLMCIVERTSTNVFQFSKLNCTPFRRSVEALLQKLFETCESESLEPLVITEDALVSVSRNHIFGSPAALANLFVDQVSRQVKVERMNLNLTFGAANEFELLPCVP